LRRQHHEKQKYGTGAWRQIAANIACADAGAAIKSGYSLWLMSLTVRRQECSQCAVLPGLFAGAGLRGEAAVLALVQLAEICFYAVL